MNLSWAKMFAECQVCPNIVNMPAFNQEIPQDVKSPPNHGPMPLHWLSRWAAARRRAAGMVGAGAAGAGRAGS